MVPVRKAYNPILAYMCLVLLKFHVLFENLVATHGHLTIIEKELIIPYELSTLWYIHLSNMLI
jgi:hypothetical protein